MKPLSLRLPLCLTATLLAAPGGAVAAAATADSAQLQVRVVEAVGQQPVPCTVRLSDAAGRWITEDAGLSGGFRSPGQFARSLPAGPVTLRVTRGPEYQAVQRELTLRTGETHTLEVVLERQVDLRRRGWFAGDSHVHMIHGERGVPVDFDRVALAAQAEDLRYLCLAHAWALDNPTPERLSAELDRRSTADTTLTWNVEAPKNYYRGDAARCLGHCWNLAMRGRTPEGADVVSLLLEASAWDYESAKPSYANFESHALIHAQGGAVFYTHPARWWMGEWGGQGGYPKQARTRVSNMAVELPLDVLAGPTFDGLDVITGAGEIEANEKAFQLWGLLLNHGYRLAPTASSDACFDRPGGAVPGAARLYTFLDEPFALPAVARAAARGRTFATTGPLLLVSLAGQPPGSVFPADGRPRTLRIEAWSSGASTGGLSRIELLRNGQPWRQFTPEGQPRAFATEVVLTDDRSVWYCARAFGADARGQRAVTGAFYFDSSPWRPPAPVPAQVRVRVVEADSGRALDATVTEVTYLGSQPRPGRRTPLPGGLGTMTMPATSRLRAESAGHVPVTLSPFFDHPALLEAITHLNDTDLLNWNTYERIRALLEQTELTFRLPRA